MLDFDILVVGAGASGLAAAETAYRSGCESILVVDSRKFAGGILPQCIHDGFGNGLTGPEYADTLIKSFRRTGAELMLSSTVLSISENRCALISTKSALIKVRFKKIILATGCEEIPLGALNISGTRPQGIYNAGQAQEMINLLHMDIGDDVVILGCGDLGMILARRLAVCGKNVIAVIEKEPTYSGLKRNFRECIEKYGIPVMFNTSISAIYGEEHLSSVTLTDGTRIPCSTLIVAAGLRPDTDLVSGLGNLPWIYKCGNCMTVHDMVESAVSQARETGKKVTEDLKLEGLI